MGELIWCAQEDAKQPYTIQPMNVLIYSLDELVFYMEQNFYSLDKNLINQNLVRWLRDELGLREFAEELSQAIRGGQSAYGLALQIFQKSGLYTRQELAMWKHRFSNMDGKTVLECRKLKADQYLREKKYMRAVREYRQVLSGENPDLMTDELRASLYHNQGVAYARMFLFPEACESFWKAYEQNHSQQSREAYLYALNYTEDGSVEDRSTAMNLDFDVMREVFSKFQNLGGEQDFQKEQEKVQAVIQSSKEMSLTERRALLTEWKKSYLESCMP